jgi:hypothetical protein
MNDAFYSRILPMDLARIQNPKPESQIQQFIQQNWKNLWCDLLEKLNQVVHSLRANPNPDYVPIRMADFAKFIASLRDVPPTTLDVELANRGLRQLEQRQMEKLLEESSLMPILQDWVDRYPEKAAEWRRALPLFNELQQFARVRSHPWNWRTPVSLINHLRSIQVEVEQQIGMQMRWVHVSKQPQPSAEYRFGANLPQEENPTKKEE